jgi:alanine racemase
VHLKIDTGLSRNGAPRYVWDELCEAAAEAESTGALNVVGVWSHLAAADEPGHVSVPLQVSAFEDACARARAAGLSPTLRHLANSAGALVLPAARYELVRVGIAAYGVEPAPGLVAVAGVELRPVMTLRAQLAAVKDLAAGVGVSYGWTWVTDRPTTVGLVPLGYADGVPRHASNRAEVGWAGERAPLRGRVCMDQFVVEVPPGAAVGDEVVLFGPGTGQAPTAADWAAWCDTIGYEIVTRIGSRVPRRYLDDGGDGGDGWRAALGRE